MKKILYILFVLLIFLPDLGAQRRNGLIGRRNGTSGSLVATVGPSFCLGDPTASIFKETFKIGVHNYDISVGFRHWFPNNLGYKGTFTYANYAGSDKPNSRGTAPLSFVSNYYEASIRAEYAIMFGSRYGYIAPSAVYGFIGGAYLNSSVTFPQYEKDGVMINSFQGNPSNSGFAIPFGLGYLFKYDTNLSIGAEFMIKYSLTDFVDGYSPKTSDFNDLIYGVSFTIGYTIF
ncbi:MAG: DUF6089 family protein [Paludibacter sp.]